MKEVTLTRYYQDDSCTLGIVSVGGINHKPFYTLENPWRNNERNVSCIPEGVYRCEWFNGNKYKDVWEVMNVPGRSAILWHKGNYPHDTRGCILPGLGVDPSRSDPMVTHSANAMNYLRELLQRQPFELKITK